MDWYIRVKVKSIKLHTILDTHFIDVHCRGIFRYKYRTQCALPTK